PTAAALERFTVNFTITNLPYNSDLAKPDSSRFKSTRRVMNTMLDRLLKETSIGPDFQGCESTAFRYQLSLSVPPQVPWGAEGLCRVLSLSNKTRGISQLGPYSLDKDSLYING
ncbi:MUC16 protein, partial [Tachuris rubrigastra]|nr:MUC16 protein [Tachuris rubrigastra]